MALSKPGSTACARLTCFLSTNPSFPAYFRLLMRTLAKRNTPPQLYFPKDTEAQFARLQDWINNHPDLKTPRTPISTTGLSREVVHAIERAVDARNGYLAASGSEKIRVTKVPLDSIVRESGGNADVSDIPVNLNKSPPLLLVIALSVSLILGVPFGLRGHCCDPPQLYWLR